MTAIKNFLVDADKKIGALNRTLAEALRTKDSISSQIEAISSRLEKLISSTMDMENAVSKINNIEGLIIHLNSEIDRIRRVKEDIVKTGEKLNSALELAKRYIGIFEEKTGKKVEDRELSEEQISTIIRLYKQGWNISRISRTVGISEDYVELIVEKYATE